MFQFHVTPSGNCHKEKRTRLQPLSLDFYYHKYVSLLFNAMSWLQVSAYKLGGKPGFMLWNVNEFYSNSNTFSFTMVITSKILSYDTGHQSFIPINTFFTKLGR